MVGGYLGGMVVGSYVTESEPNISWCPISLDDVMQIRYGKILELCEILVATSECITLLNYMEEIYRSDFWSSAFFWFRVCVLVICDKYFSILRLDLIDSQNFITVFLLFVHMWYLLKTVTVVFITIYVMFVIVVSRMSLISSWGLMRVRK